jgi:hypothetical protein
VYRLDPAFVEVLNDSFDQFLSSLGKNITNIHWHWWGTCPGSPPPFRLPDKNIADDHFDILYRD